VTSGIWSAGLEDSHKVRVRAQYDCPSCGGEMMSRAQLLLLAVEMLAPVRRRDEWRPVGACREGLVAQHPGQRRTLCRNERRSRRKRVSLFTRVSESMTGVGPERVFPHYPKAAPILRIGSRPVLNLVQWRPARLRYTGAPSPSKVAWRVLWPVLRGSGCKYAQPRRVHPS
jgi:hypothetical protein